jgi:hypothetical protein
MDAQQEEIHYKMKRFSQKGREVYLESPEFCLKIDTKRWVYIKAPNDTIYHKTSVQVQPEDGKSKLDKAEKEVILDKYYIFITQAEKDEADTEERNEEEY